MKIKVGVVDDHKLFRTGFVLLLSQLNQVKVMFHCANAIELFEQLKIKKIDILFLDIQMPIMNGFDTTAKLNEIYPHLKILILSSFNDSYTIQRILKYKIAGYITKNASESQIRRAIYHVFEDGIYYDNQIKHIVNNIQASDYKKEANLTAKEVELIKLFVQQYSGREVAEKLHLSIRTVEKHKEIIMQKAGATNFIGAIVYAILRHYISEDDFH